MTNSNGKACRDLDRVREALRKADGNDDEGAALASMTSDREIQEKSAECAREARKQAALLAPGKVRDALMEKARQYEAEIPEDHTYDKSEAPSR